MQFKVGDNVVVHKRLLVDGHTDGLYWNPSMDKYDGLELTVCEVINRNKVHLHGARRDNGVLWYFHTKWLEPVSNEDLDCGDFTVLISNI